MLRPLDLQDNFSKAPLAAREQNIQQIRGEVTQHNMAQQMDQEHVLDHSRVRKSVETDGAETRVDDHDRQPGKKQRQRRQQQDDENGVDQQQTRPLVVGDGHIDVTV